MRQLSRIYLTRVQEGVEYKLLQAEPENQATRDGFAGFYRMISSWRIMKTAKSIFLRLPPSLGFPKAYMRIAQAIKHTAFPGFNFLSGLPGYSLATKNLAKIAAVPVGYSWDISNCPRGTIKKSPLTEVSPQIELLPYHTSIYRTNYYLYIYKRGENKNKTKGYPSRRKIYTSYIRLSHLKYIPRSAASQYYPHGQGHHNSVLTEALVIRSRQDKSSPHREFARAHGLGKYVNAIAAARTGQTWKYLSDKYPHLDVDFTPRGEKHPFAKLTEDDVAKILSSKHKVSAAVLAKQYGVSVQTIHSIWNGKSWKHVHPNFPNGSGGGCDG